MVEAENTTTKDSINNVNDWRDSWNRSWKVVRELIENGKCRLFGGCHENVENIAARWRKIANRDYLTQQKRTLMVTAMERVN